MIRAAIAEWSMRRLDHLAARLSPRSNLPEHLETGLRGEREALFHLSRHGYVIVARRWTSPRARGDLDLIAWQAATLCFVEVKTRTARDAMTAESAVDRDKRIQLRRLAQIYLKSFDEPEGSQILTRFDVVSVYLLGRSADGPSVECAIQEDAFGWSEPPSERRSQTNSW